MTPQKNALLTYQVLYVAQQDLSQAAFFAQHLLDKGWHYEPWEVRWQTYLHQGAYMTSMVVAYSRSFTESRGFPKFPTRLLQSLTAEDRVLHKRLLGLRNGIYAHTDVEARKVRPFVHEGRPNAIEVLPPMRMTSADLQHVRALISKISHAVIAKLHELAPEVGERT